MNNPYPKWWATSGGLVASFLGLYLVLAVFIKCFLEPLVAVLRLLFHK
jgi:hypothetical protein